jgi:hypothetical protein
MTLFHPEVIIAQRRRIYTDVTLHQRARLAAFALVEKCASRRRMHSTCGMHHFVVLQKRPSYALKSAYSSLAKVRVIDLR